MLSRALVTSRLDYCNGLLSGIYLKCMLKLQNTAARVIVGARKYQYITPEGLTDLLKWYNRCRSLRSGSKKLLLVPKTRLKTFGDAAFSVHTPVLRLPGYKCLLIWSENLVI